MENLPSWTMTIKFLSEREKTRVYKIGKTVKEGLKPALFQDPKYIWFTDMNMVEQAIPLSNILYIELKENL